jgi:hypothetical protein
MFKRVATGIFFTFINELAFVMIPKRFWVLLACLMYFNLDAQKKPVKGLSISGELALNHSYLTYNLNNVENRNSLELRLGGVVEKSIGDHFSLRSGLRLGIKPKTNYSTSQFSLTYHIDNTFSSSNHYYIELPATVIYQWKQFQIGTGVLGRHYINTSSSGSTSEPDFLKGNYEIGINSIITYEIFKKVRVGVEGYFGLSSIFSTYHVTVSLYPGSFVSGYTFKAKNNFVGLNISYRIR